MKGGSVLIWGRVLQGYREMFYTDNWGAFYKNIDEGSTMIMRKVLQGYGGKVPHGYGGTFYKDMKGDEGSFYKDMEEGGSTRI